MNRNGVEKVEIATNRPAKVVVKRLRPNFENIERIPKMEVDRIVNDSLPGFWFVNPIARIHSPEESEAAFAMASKYHGEWFRHIRYRGKNTWLKDSTRSMDWMSFAHAFIGVVVMRSTVIPYTWWKDCRQVHLDPTSVFERRPDALPFFKAGDFESLKRIQADEVNRILVRAPFKTST